jgi:hypothetical protein
MSANFYALKDAFRDVLAATGDRTVEDFTAGLDWNMPARTLPGRSIKCLSQLGRIAELAPARFRRLTGVLANDAGGFHWGQTYVEADFGRHFIDNYGWLEVFGARGHFLNESLAGGLLVLGPQVVYPDHHHVAEEIYIPLTGGTDWRMGDSPFAARDAGEIIHHASNVNHAMRTGDQPLLALYLWRGGPLAARSTITGTVAEVSR